MIKFEMLKQGLNQELCFGEPYWNLRQKENNQKHQERIVNQVGERCTHFRYFIGRMVEISDWLNMEKGTQSLHLVGKATQGAKQCRYKING